MTAAVEAITHDKVLELSLNANETNALTKAALFELNAALKRLESDTKVKVLLLTSKANGYFSNGLDPTLFLDQPKSIIEENTRLLFETGGRLFFFPRPTIALVNGHCMGGGSVFALYCDYRFLNADKGRFGFPEILISMSFPAFGAKVLQDVVGAKNCRDLLFTGKALKPAQALEVGLADGLYPGPQLFEEGLRFAKKLASHTIESLTTIKQARRNFYEPFLHSVLDKDIQTMVTTIMSKNSQEGFRSLLEKRRAILLD